jgi:hypothetical protein
MSIELTDPNNGEIYKIKLLKFSAFNKNSIMSDQLNHNPSKHGWNKIDYWNFYGTTFEKFKPRLIGKITLKDMIEGV